MAKKETSYGETDELLDQLLAGADPKTAFVKDGLLDDLKKAFAERALNAEIDHHLDKGEEPERLWPKIGFHRDQQDRAFRATDCQPSIRS